LLDAGGSYTGSGGNLAFNGNFALKSSGNNPKGWTLWQGTATFGSNFVRITSNGGNVRQNSQRFPVVNGETLYVYCQTNVYAGSSLQVSYYSADTGTSGFAQTQTVSHSDGTLKFTAVTGGNGASRGFGVAAVTVPTNLNAKFAELRMRCTNSTGVYYFNVGISRTPPVIDPSYVSTYIRNLSVDTLQIAGNAVIVPIGASNENILASYYLAQSGGMTTAGTSWKKLVDTSPISWTSSDLAPEAITIIACANIGGAVSGTGNTSIRTKLIMRTSPIGTNLVIGAFSGNTTGVTVLQSNGESKREDFSTTVTLNHTITVSALNLQPNTNYYFALVGQNSGNARSMFSNGISVVASKK
jgi:hypothetical protein